MMITIISSLHHHMQKQAHIPNGYARIDLTTQQSLSHFYDNRSHTTSCNRETIMLILIGTLIAILLIMIGALFIDYPRIYSTAIEAIFGQQCSRALDVDRFTEKGLSPILDAAWEQMKVCHSNDQDIDIAIHPSQFLHSLHSPAAQQCQKPPTYSPHPPVPDHFWDELHIHGYTEDPIARMYHAGT